MKTHVQYISRVKSVFEVISDIHYSINQSGKFKWLQKLCLRVLKKYGVACKHHPALIEFKNIEYEKIIDLIMDNVNTVEYIDHMKCKYIVLGHDKMKEIMMNEYMIFHVPLDAGLRSNQRKFLGMTIVLVPWIKGVFCLPELN